MNSKRWAILFALLTLLALHIREARCQSEQLAEAYRIGEVLLESAEALGVGTDETWAIRRNKRTYFDHPKTKVVGQVNIFRKVWKKFEGLAGNK